MRHGQEVSVAVPPDEDTEMWLGLSMPIELYRYLYPCKCEDLCYCWVDGKYVGGEQ